MSIAHFFIVHFFIVALFCFIFLSFQKKKKNDSARQIYSPTLQSGCKAREEHPKSLRITHIAQILTPCLLQDNTAPDITAGGSV